MPITEVAMAGEDSGPGPLQLRPEPPRPGLTLRRWPSATEPQLLSSASSLCPLGATALGKGRSGSWGFLAPPESPGGQGWDALPFYLPSEPSAGPAAALQPPEGPAHQDSPRAALWTPADPSVS